jgi:putative glycosyltransferase (TIGR04372 family)
VFLADKSDFMDIWLFSNCKMIISTGSGPDVLGIINQIPILFVNYLPLTGHHQYANAMVAPKLLRKEHTGEFLSAREVYKANFDSTGEYQSAGIEPIDLSETLLLDCVKEFVEYVDLDCKPKVAFSDFLKRLRLPHRDIYINPSACVSKTWLDYVGFE